MTFWVIFKEVSGRPSLGEVKRGMVTPVNVLTRVDMM